MRSEAEIRKQVEARLKRWLYLIADGGLWLTAVFLYWRGSGGGFLNLGQFTGAGSLFLTLWFVAVGLHMLWVLYATLRDWLVGRAVEHERRYYVMSSTPDDAEKPKRQAPAAHDTAVSRLELTNDGELIEFDDLDAEDSYVPRNLN